MAVGGAALSRGAGRVSKRLDRLSERAFALVVSVPSLLLVGLVVLPPTFAVFALSLFRIELGKDDKTPFVGLNNFLVRLPADHIVLDAIPRTLIFAGAITAVTLPLALITALVLNRRFRGDSIFFMALLVPWAISSIVTGIFWRLMFDVQFGIVNGILIGVGAITKPINWLENTGVAIVIAVIATAWRSVPLLALLLLAALRTIPSALYRAAKMDGATTWQAFRFITVPAIRPTLLVVGILQVILGMQVFDLLYSLTSGGPGYDTTVLVYTIYNTAFQDLSFGYAAAITVLLFGLIVIASVLLALVQRGGRAKPPVFAENEELSTAGRGSLRLTIAPPTQQHETWETAPARRRWRPPAFLGRFFFGAGVVFLLFFFLAPIVWIFIMSFQPKDALGTLPPHLTTNLWLDGYTTILRDDRWQASLIVSLETAILTTILVLVIAAPAAYSLSRFKLPGKNIILGVLIFTLFVPVIVMAIPVLRLFQILHLTDTVQALVIVNVAFWLPLITWLLRNFFNEVPIAIENAARIDGTSRLGTLFRITIPAARPGIAAAAILILIGTWNEFLFAVVLGNHNAVTISRRIIGLNSFDFFGVRNISPPPDLLAASGMIAVAPCLLLVLLFHRRIITGLTEGLVKG
jgi:multiple sugar transport system permease protein